MMLCSLVASFQCFGGTYCLHLQISGGDSFIRNVGNHLHDYTASQPRRPHFKSSPLTSVHQINFLRASSINNKQCEQQDWKGILFGVHWNSEGVLHATLRAVTSTVCFVDNHCSKEQCTYATLTERKKYSNGVKCSNSIRVNCFNNVIGDYCVN
jgi:hypothetical protein